MTRLKIAIRVYPSPAPRSPDEIQTAPVDVSEFTAGVSRVLEAVLPRLWEKEKVGVQCCSLPVLQVVKWYVIRRVWTFFSGWLRFF